jgi:hypothetical protein
MKAKRTLIKNARKDEPKMSQDSIDQAESDSGIASSEEAVAPATATFEQTQKRAFELYVARQQSGVYGTALDDWLQAERELMNTQSVS